MFEAEGPATTGPTQTLKEQIEAFERRLIETALAEAGDNQRKAAELLGVLPTTLCEKIKRLGIRPTPKYIRNRGKQ